MVRDCLALPGAGVRTDLAPALEFAAATLEIAAKRRLEPQDDLISMWVHAGKEDGSRLTDDEIVSEALLVQNGGAETTRAVIAQTVMNLIDYPAERQKLIDDPSPDPFGARRPPASPRRWACRRTYRRRPSST